MSEEFEKNERGDLFSKSVRAGKRTYFFDVKSTRGNDYYLTITESKKRFGTDGKFTYEKHKVFLYKEDFEKFLEGLNEAITHIKENAPVIENNYESRENNNENGESNTESNESSLQSGEKGEGSDIRFEDLGK